MNDAPIALRELQTWFQQMVMQSRISDGEQLAGTLDASSKQTAVERLAIYQRAYWARLVECLKGMFPAVLEMLGDEAFDALATAYLRQHPPTSYTLNALADHWVAFLQASRPPRENKAFDWADFLIDLAQLERAIDEVFDGPGVEGQPTLAVDRLQTLSPEQASAMRVKLAPCVRLLAFQFPVNTYYTQFRQHAGEPPPLPVPAATYLLLHRSDYVVQRAPLMAPQHALLEALQSGETLGTAIVRVVEAHPQEASQIASQLQTWFQEWAAAGVFLTVE